MEQLHPNHVSYRKAGSRRTSGCGQQCHKRQVPGVPGAPPTSSPATAHCRGGESRTLITVPLQLAFIKQG